jgi:hypothetical protein
MANWSKEPNHQAQQGIIGDFYSGPSWTSFCKDPQVGDDKPSNVKSFGFSAAIDGIIPFKRRNHTLWPLALTCMNFPPFLRNRLEAIHIPFVIPGEHYEMLGN